MYEGSASPASSLDPRFKVLAGLVVGIAVVVAHDAPQFVAIASLVVAMAILARLPALVLWSNLRPIFLFLIFAAALFALTTPGRGWDIGPGHVSVSGLLLAARLSTQLVLLIMTTSLVTFTTSPFSIAHALRRLLRPLGLVRIPVEDMTTMLTIAITFLPVMSQEADRYLTARVARGAGERRFGMWSMLGDMLVPMIQNNLQRGDELTLALETRLYGYGKRTHRLDEERVGWPSIAMLIIVCAWTLLSLVFL
jgi:energy-coupling factor transport system permease protein